MPELFHVRTPPDAWQLFCQHFQPRPEFEHIRVVDALDRVLAVELTAPHHLPNFPRSTVDGYAVVAMDTYGASPGLPAFLEIVGEAPMGMAPEISVAIGQCAVVHTGGMLPPGADAVVMIENTQRVDERSIELMAPAAEGENVVQVGEDVRMGDHILPGGHHLRPQDLGGLLALGITEVSVTLPARVSILSQGDEVVPPEQEPGPGQIRDINSYTLAALTRRAGGEPVLHPVVPDDRAALDAAARQALDAGDLLVISAGSSVSERDMTVDVISGLGQPGPLVHGVSVKPGKPTILAVCDGKPVFGLPGNPVSAMVIFELFVAPTIRALLGARESWRPSTRARLAHNVSSATGREDYVQVRLEERNGELWAAPVFGKSNLIYTLIRAQGSVRIPLDSNGIAEGEWVTVWLH